MLQKDGAVHGLVVRVALHVVCAVGYAQAAERAAPAPLVRIARGRCGSGRYAIGRVPLHGEVAPEKEGRVHQFAEIFALFCRHEIVREETRTSGKRWINSPQDWQSNSNGQRALWHDADSERTR